MSALNSYDLLERLNTSVEERVGVCFTAKECGHLLEMLKRHKPESLSLTRYECTSGEGDYNAGMEPSMDGEYVSYEDAQRIIDAQQAEIDRLMMEFCPDEMTKEQLANWAASQKCADCTLIGQAACPEHGTK